MVKECPICGESYTETQWRRRLATWSYRAWRHFKDGVVTWCKGAPGKHYARVETRSV